MFTTVTDSPVSDHTQTIPFTSVSGRTVPRHIATRVLIAEDEDDMRRALASVLREDGYTVIEAADGEQLAQRIWSGQVCHGEVDVDLIISDVRMAGLSGLEMLAYLRMSQEHTPMILITAFGTADLKAKAERLGAVAVIDKPLDLQDFRAFVRDQFPPSGGPRSTVGRHDPPHR